MMGGAVLDERISDAYFAFTGRELEEVFFFLRSEPTNPQFSDVMICFLREVFIIKMITHAEAETYEAFGVAPIIGAEDLSVIPLGGWSASMQPLSWS